MSAPLEGVRVLDLSRLLPGPFCTMVLADLGADVVKVEQPGTGDPVRALHPSLFALVNRNKRGVCLDLGSSAGRGALLALARDADVLVEGFRPGTMRRLGLDADTLEAVNPRLVRASLPAWGASGPYRDRPGHDLNCMALAGALEQTGPRDGAPVPGAIPVADLAGGALTAAVGILAALLRAQRTGRGGAVSASLLDGTLGLQVTGLATLHALGRLPPRGEDTLTGGLPVYRCYACADGRHVAIATLERAFWRAFCEAVERPDLFELVPDPLAPGAAARQLHAALAALLATRARDDWARLFDEHGLCATPVLTLEEALEHPQVAARGMTVEVDGRLQIACPLAIDGFEFRVRRPAPQLGEHQLEVLAGCGYAEETARALAAGNGQGGDGSG